jgi:hypothetical protein
MTVDFLGVKEAAPPDNEGGVKGDRDGVVGKALCGRVRGVGEGEGAPVDKGVDDGARDGEI